MKYIAFFRGINVGGRIIKMTDLKDCLEKAGFENVQTILQTGNVIVESNLNSTEAVENEMEKQVAKRFNYDAKILVTDQASLEKVVSGYPFDKTETDFQHYVILLRPGLAKSLAEQAVDLDSKFESVAPGDEVVYWKVLKGMTLKSDFSKQLTRAQFKESNTVRNINTLEKILVKAEG